MKTAKKIRVIGSSQAVGHATLYKLSEPLKHIKRDWDENDTDRDVDYVIVSTIDDPLETLIFEAHPDGNWETALAGAGRGYTNHKDALKSIGYELEMPSYYEDKGFEV